MNESKIVTIDVGFPALGRIFTEMERLGISRNFDRQLDTASLPFIDVVIIGAWWPEATLVASTLRDRYKKRVWVLWASPLLQAELSVAEIDYLPWIKRLIKEETIEYVLTGSQEMVEYFGERSRFIKYPLSMKPLPRIDAQMGHAGLFGPIHYRKNILHQLMALSKDFTIHTGPIDGAYKNFAQSLGVRLIEHPWLPEEEFYKLVASMEFGLQCSVPGVESFSYTVYDFLQMDRPVISTVEWLQENWSGFRYPDIRSAIERLRKEPREKYHYRRMAEKMLVEHNEGFRKTIADLYNSPAIH